MEFWLARRLQWRTDPRKRTSPSVPVAVAGVALSVVVMMVAVAVVLGFKQQVRTKLCSVTDSLTITASTDEYVHADALQPLLSLPEGAEVVGHIDMSGVLKTDTDFLGVHFLGLDTLGSDSLVVSDVTARTLGLTVGDRVPVYFFVNGRLRARPLTVAHTYSTGISEHDRSVAYCSASMLRALLGVDDDEVTSVGIRGVEPEQTPALAAELRSQLLNAYYTGRTADTFEVTTILDTDGMYFSWLQLLDTNVVVILCLMGAVAAFTLISSLFIIILERVRTIGLLKAMGASNGLIRRVFMLMGERLVFSGLVVGNVLALSLLLVQQRTHFIPLDADTYYVDFVPVLISPWSVVLINVGAVALSWLVLMLPALVIARISPASTIRYE